MATKKTVAFQHDGVYVVLPNENDFHIAASILEVMKNAGKHSDGEPAALSASMVFQKDSVKDILDLTRIRKTGKKLEKVDQIMDRLVLSGILENQFTSRYVRRMISTNINPDVITAFVNQSKDLLKRNRKVGVSAGTTDGISLGGSKQDIYSELVSTKKELEKLKAEVYSFKEMLTQLLKNDSEEE